jgi:hypothetical protein
MSLVDEALSKWNEEIEKETVKLIERGTRPEVARIEAENIVSERRKRKNADKSGG